MKEIKILIKENSEKIISVKASSEQEALEKVKKMYKEQDVHFDNKEKNTEFSVYLGAF